MDLKQKGFAETPSRFHQLMDDSATNLTDAHLFPQFNFLHYIPGTSISEISPRLQSSSPLGPKVKKQGQSESSSSFETQNLTWDPTAMLNKLSFLEQKIHQVQDIILCMAKRDGQFSVQANELAAQQQLVTADLTSIIVQLIAAAGTLLPSTKNSITSFSNANTKLGISIPSETMSASDFDDLIKGLSECGPEGDELVKILKTPGAEMSEVDPMEDHDLKDTEDGADGDHLLPGSYQVLQLEKEEILAPHTHFCMICGKGFKRDANLRMHMRGHGDEYKSPAALAKPIKELNSEAVPIRRYSCPFMGCKRNKEHKKFLPLKTILCVKNHYKRSHCDKRYTCSRCNCKKFSVLADLKTHEKHCGRDKWLCSCGTTFSRKDKLFGHVALFQGHTPALPTDECKASSTYDHGIDNGGNDGGIDTVCKFGSSSGFDGANVPDTKGIEDDRGLFSLMNFDSYNFGGLDEFPRLAFGVSEDSFSLASSGSSSFMPRNGVN